MKEKGVDLLHKSRRRPYQGWREDIILFYWKERKRGDLKAELYGWNVGMTTQKNFMLMPEEGRWKIPFGACRMRWVLPMYLSRIRLDVG